MIKSVLGAKELSFGGSLAQAGLLRHETPVSLNIDELGLRDAGAKKSVAGHILT